MASSQLLLADPQLIWDEVWPLIADGTPRPPSAAVELTVHRDGDRGAVTYRFDDGQSAVAKSYPDASEARASAGILRALAGGGFGNGATLRVPQLHGLVRDDRVIVMEAVQGETLTERTRRSLPTADDDVRAAAAWLGRLHASPLRLGPIEDPAGAGLRLARRAAKAAARRPDREKTITGALAALSRRLAPCSARLATTHGRFHADHVFFGPAGVTVIDADRAAVTDPAKDVGEFVHRLRWRAHKDGADPAAVDRATEAFLAEYRRWAPIDPDTLVYHWSYAVVFTMLGELSSRPGDNLAAWESNIGFLQAELATIRPRPATSIHGDTPGSGDAPALDPSGRAAAMNGKHTLPARTVEEVARAFALGQPGEVRYLPSRINDNFLVATDTGRYVVRVSSPRRTMDDVRAEHRLLERLASGGVPTTPPLRTATGGVTERVIDGRIYRVTRFVDGAYPEDLDADQTRSVAAALARYHQAARELDHSSKDAFRPVRDSLRSGLLELDWPAPSSRRPGSTDGREAIGAYLRHWLEVTHDHLAKVDHALPRLMIHGSCRYQSFLFQEGRLVAMLDFDNGYPDVRTLDLAIALLSFASVRPEKERFDIAAAQIFLDGYQTVERLSGEELALVPWYMRARILKRELGRWDKAVARPTELGDARLRRAAARLAWLEDNGHQLIAPRPA